MASRMSQGLAWLASQQEDMGGESATYTRGSKTISIVFIPGPDTPSRSAVADGRVQFEVEPADFFVRPALIDFGDGQVEPARGDRLTLEDGSVYEVSPRDGEPEWKWADLPYKNLLRIRSVRVS